MKAFFSMLFLMTAFARVDGAPNAWTKCDVYTPGWASLFSRMDCTVLAENVTSTMTASCGNLSAPLDYSSDKTINYFVKRVEAPNGPSQGEIWLLNGGPGGGGVTMECLIADLIEGTGGRFDIVIPDHRGVGRSSPLNCGWGPNDMNQSAQVPTAGCMKKMVGTYGAEYLQSFTVTNAAKDIHWAIQEHERTHPHLVAASENYTRMLYGVSYGTYLGQRYLQQFPDEMGAVVLDGVCAPDLTRLAYYDYGTDASFSVFMTECAKDTKCVKNLGPNPVYSVHLLYELIRSGHLACPAKMGLINNSTYFASPSYLKGRLGGMSMSWDTRFVILPVIARLLRCNANDVKALKYFFGVALAPDGYLTKREMERKRVFPHLHLSPATFPVDAPDPSLIQNALLQLNIGASEMFDYDFTHETAQSVEDSNTLLNVGEADEQMASVREMMANISYPFYKPDPALYNKYPETTTNILMLEGTTDPQTPHEWAVHAFSHYKNDNQQLVVIPNSVHASAFPGTSPVQPPSDGSAAPTCGMQMARSFFDSGGTTVDKSCLGRLLPPDFAGNSAEIQALSKKAFGTSDLWGSTD